MTEEIIIDGVDVRGCRYFQDGMCYAEKDNEGYTDIECNYDNYDCYFKQLKRIKPENEALYVLKNSLCKMIDEDSEKIKRLEQENKELRREIAELRKDCNHCNFHKYRSALEEIKHILEIYKDELEECLHNDIDGMIQTKINEVLDTEA